MYFVLSWLARCYACFAVEYFSLGFRVGKCHGVFSAQLKHKRKVSGLPYDTRRYLAGMFVKEQAAASFCLVCGKGNADSYIIKS